MLPPLGAKTKFSHSRTAAASTSTKWLIMLYVSGVYSLIALKGQRY